MTNYAVEILDVSKAFGEQAAVRNVTMQIAEGEFFSLLGPSGCGKTTTLRMIAGFEFPTSGRIRLLGEDIQDKPPHQRNVNMVFQNYALFPHLSVFDNVAFGLNVKRVPRSESRDRVAAALAMVRLSGMERRKPGQLSGGQQQRVALARALVNRPAVVLLDEPLGALDQKLRKDMQLELKQLQRALGLTFIYVTHDQEEALVMSDRIAVMNQGHVLQVADPVTLYDRPTSRFVADFIGISNFIDGRIVSIANDQVAVQLDTGNIIYAPHEIGLENGQQVTLAVRPERMTFQTSSQHEGNNSIRGTVEETVFVGNDTQYLIHYAHGQHLIVREQNRVRRTSSPVVKRGDEIVVIWLPENTLVLRE